MSKSLSKFFLKLAIAIGACLIVIFSFISFFHTSNVLAEGLTDYNNIKGDTTTVVDESNAKLFLAVVEDEKVISLIKKDEINYILPTQKVYLCFGITSETNLDSTLQTGSGSVLSIVSARVDSSALSISGTSICQELTLDLNKENNFIIDVTFANSDSEQKTIQFKTTITNGLLIDKDPTFDEGFSFDSSDVITVNCYSKKAVFFVAIVDSASNKVVSLVKNGSSFFVEQGQVPYIVFGAKKAGSQTDLVTSDDVFSTVNISSITFAGATIKNNYDLKNSNDYGYYIVKAVDNRNGLLECKLSVTLINNGTLTSPININYSCYLFNKSTYQKNNNVANTTFGNCDDPTENNIDNSVARDIYSNNRNEKPTYIDYNPDLFNLKISRTFQGIQYDYAINQITNSDDTKTVTIQKEESYPDLWCDYNNESCKIYFKDLGEYSITYIYKFGDVILEDINSSSLNRSDVVHVFGIQANYSSQKKELRTQNVLSGQSTYQADVTYKNVTIDGATIRFNGADVSTTDIANFASTNLAPVSFLYNVTKKTGAYKLYKYESSGWVDKGNLPDVISDSGTYIASVTYTYEYPTKKKEGTQYFAFVITTSNPSVTVKETNNSGDTLYSSDYTKENIYFYADKLKAFDSDVVVNIYRTDFKSSASEMQYSLIKTQKLNEDKLEYTAEEDGRYKLEIIYGANGKNTSISYFNRDNTAIDYATYYVTLDSNTGKYVKSDRFLIEGEGTANERFKVITNEKFVVLWNNKASGANITCNYDFVPLYIEDSSSVAIFNENNVNFYVPNNYYLDFSAESKNNPVTNSSQNVLSTAGLYLFTINDSAGNKKCFAVFYDNSQVLVVQKGKDEADTEYKSISGINIVDTSTTVFWGTHKAILLKNLPAGFDYESVGINGYCKTNSANTNNYFVVAIKDAVLYVNGVEKSVKDETGKLLTAKDIDVQSSDDELKDYKFYFYDESNKFTTETNNLNKATNKFSISTTCDQTATCFVSTDFGAWIGSTGSSITSDTKYQYYHVAGQNVWMMFKEVSSDAIIQSCGYDIKYYAKKYDETSKTMVYETTPQTYELEDYTVESYENYKYIKLNFGATEALDGKYVITRTYTYKVKPTESNDFSVRVLTLYVDTDDVLTYDSKTIKYSLFADDTICTQVSSLSSSDYYIKIGNSTNGYKVSYDSKKQKVLFHGNYYELKKETASPYYYYFEANSKEIGEYIDLLIKNDYNKSFDEFYRQSQDLSDTIETAQLAIDVTQTEKITEKAGEIVPTLSALGSAIIETNYMPNLLTIPLWKYGNQEFDGSKFKFNNTNGYDNVYDADFKLDFCVYVYDETNNKCYNITKLLKIYARNANSGFDYDTGNYSFAFFTNNFSGRNLSDLLVDLGINVNNLSKLSFAIKIFDGICTDISAVDENTHSIWFRFDILLSGPQIEMEAYSKNDVNYEYVRDVYVDSNGCYYLNTDKVKINKKSSSSKYISEIDSVINENGAAMTADANGLYDISDLTKIVIKYAGSASDYFNNKSFQSTYNLKVNKTAPTSTINSLIEKDNVVSKEAMSDLRTIGSGYNRTISSGIFAKYAYLYDENIINNMINNCFACYIQQINDITTYNQLISPYCNGATSSNAFIPSDNVNKKGSTYTFNQGCYYDIVEVDEYGNMTSYIVYCAKQNEQVIINNVTFAGDEAYVVEEDSEFSIGSFSILKDSCVKIEITDVTDTNNTTKVFYRTPTSSASKVFQKTESNEISISDMCAFTLGKSYKITFTKRSENKVFALNILMFDQSHVDSSRRDSSYFGLSTNGDYSQVILTDNKELNWNNFITNASIYILGDDSFSVQCEYETSNGLIKLTPRDSINVKDKIYLVVLKCKSFDSGMTENIFYIGLNRVGEDYCEFSCSDIEDFPLEGSDQINKVSTDVVIKRSNLYNVKVNKVEKSDNEIILQASRSIKEAYTGQVESFVVDISLNSSELSNIIGSLPHNSKEYIYLTSYSKTYNFEIDNRLPRIIATSNSGEDRTNLLNGSSFTIEGINLSYSFDTLKDDDYTITYKKDDVDMGNLVNNFYVTEKGEYIITVKKKGYSAFENYYLIIKSQNDKAYEIKGRRKGENISSAKTIKQSDQYYLYGTQYYPLYVTNLSEISVSSEQSMNISVTESLVESDNYHTVKKYHISNENEVNVSRTINEDVIVMVVNETNDIGADLKYSTNSQFENLTGSSKSVYVDKSDLNDFSGLKIRFNNYSNGNKYNRIKLILILNEACGRKYIIGSQEDGGEILSSNYIVDDDKKEYLLKEDGLYTLILSDEAGNIESFKVDNKTYNEYSLGLYKSVPFYVYHNEDGTGNGNPIPYAIFNNDKPVLIKLSNEIIYDDSSKPKISVVLNGKEIGASSNEKGWIFTQTGFYTITFYGAAKKLNNNNTINFADTKYSFTILDSNDARLAFNWSEYDDYKITSIKINGNEQVSDVGQQKTEYSKSVYNGDQSGVYEITISPHLSNSNLTLDDFSFKFNLRMPDTAPIIVNLEQGKVSKKTITFSYNKSNIYQSIGNCIIVIDHDGELSKEYINANNCADEIVSNSITEAGTYYLKIYNQSNNLLYSYKVIKKDPLNTIAIILIVVGSVAFVALTIIFIKIRKKIKIK